MGLNGKLTLWTHRNNMGLNGKLTLWTHRNNMGLNGKLAGPCGHIVITAYFVISDLDIENFYCIMILILQNNKYFNT